VHRKQVLEAEVAVARAPVGGLRRAACALAHGRLERGGQVELRDEASASASLRNDILLTWGIADRVVGALATARLHARGLWDQQAAYGVSSARPVAL
jgi:hypothetical protein